MSTSHFPRHYFPVQAADYCCQLWEKWEFDFKVVAPRKTRLGDFRFQIGKKPVITVNNNLNPYSFLITYLHEVAHCIVFRSHRKRVAPHGKEWKSTFASLLSPVLSEAIFPKHVLNALIKYAVNPKASTTTDAPLMLALQQVDQVSTLSESANQLLSELAIGTTFKFRNRVFQKASLRRTRILCVDQQNRKQYTLPAYVYVEVC